MPLNVSAIQKTSELRDITLDFGEAGTVEMTVDPNKFTIGYQRRIRQAIKDNDAAAQADTLFSVIKSWDLTGDDGEPLPLNQEGVDTLTLATVAAIATKMSEALGAPKSETSNA